MVQETSFGNDRDQKTKRTATVTKGTRGNVSHRVRIQSISQERGMRLRSFVLKRMFTKGDPSLPHNDLSPWEQRAVPLEEGQRTHEREHVGILPSNIPRQQMLLLIPWCLLE